MRSNDRTIAAISTPQGVGGISVIRISGNEAISICDKIFKGKNRLSDADSHTVHYGFIVNSNGDIVDEVLVTVMKAPRTYTREDVVEISTHGGFTASKSVMEVLMNAGIYPAEAGEFTKRAFLNGRIDLSQAEGVIDLINSKTALEQKNALSQARGRLYTEIDSIRKALVHLSAQMQVSIDYPDEDLEDVTIEDIKSELQKNSDRITALLNTADNGKILKDGLKTAIVGKPNVGKSSLLNLLADYECAIVTDIEGTTRDVIEEFVTVDGVPLRLLDTAGIRNTDDKVEKIGVERAKKVIEDAALVLLVMDLSREIDENDKELLELTKDKKRIIIANKSDIKTINIDDAIEISAKNGNGLNKLTQKIKQMYNFAEIENEECIIITNMRHISALSNAKTSLNRAMASLEGGMPQDISALDIYETIDFLGEITGDTVSEDIVSDIFHNFCVGK